MDDFQALEEALHQAAMDLGWLKQIADLTLQHNEAVALGVPSDIDGFLNTLKDYWPKCWENRNRAWCLLYPARQWIVQTEPVAMGGEWAASWCELTVQTSAPGIVDICWRSPSPDDTWKNCPDLYAGMVAESLSEFDESRFISRISIEVRNARQRMLAEGVKPVFWSPFLSSQDWVKRLELSETSFRRKRENQQIIAHPDSSRGDGISLLLSSLPEDERS